MPASQPVSAAVRAPRLVLDTNAVLDWLVFGDSGMAATGTAIRQGAVQWVASARMRSELARTLSYESLARWKPDSVRTLTCFDHWALPLPEPASRAAGSLVCSDPDDQVFVDLALAAGARWLLTKDGALLKLRRQALAHGLHIVRPLDWVPG